MRKIHIVTNLSLYTTKAVIVLDSQGKRMFSKYYTPDYATLKDQKSFEKSLFEKTRKNNSEIIMFDGQVVVFKNSIDIYVYFVGSADENELILSSILHSFLEALSILFKGQVESRLVLENLDLVLLALDETIDDGIILESEATQIASRVTKKNTDDSIPLTEQTLSQAFQSVGEQVARRFSDLHGNLDQYRQLVELTIKTSECIALLIGGDLCPRREKLVSSEDRKSPIHPSTPIPETCSLHHIHPIPNLLSNQTVWPLPFSKIQALVSIKSRTISPTLQRDWFKNALDILKTSPVPANLSYWKQQILDINSEYPSNPPLIQLLDSEIATLPTRPHSIRLPPSSNEPELTQEKLFYVLGFPFVPPSPHSIKDHEAHDLIQEDKESMQRSLGVNFGAVSRIPPVNHEFDNLDEFSPVFFPAYLSQLPGDSIEGLLDSITNKYALGKADGISSDRLIVMAHGPPFETVDKTRRGEITGSLALLRWILRLRPLATLSGHIHEAVDSNDGKFMFCLPENENETTKRKSVVMGSGNNFKSSKLSYITLDLENPEKSSRSVLRVKRENIS
ncbi:Coatomer subunit zeta-1 [Nowakowskiella sp. JEL0078]|nr:Coatomer subunit zeta-1 [Nowakowskiella sp. JEL0078]